MSRLLSCALCLALVAHSLLAASTTRAAPPSLALAGRLRPRSPALAGRELASEAATASRRLSGEAAT